MHRIPKAEVLRCVLCARDQHARVRVEPPQLCVCVCLRACVCVCVCVSCVCPFSCAWGVCLSAHACVRARVQVEPLKLSLFFKSAETAPAVRKQGDVRPAVLYNLLYIYIYIYI